MDKKAFVLSLLLMSNILPGACHGQQNEAEYLGLGLELYGKSRFEEAIRVFSHGISVYSGNARLYLHRGNAYYSKSDFISAINDFTAECALDPGFALAYYNRAVAYYCAQDYGRAWQDIRVARSLGYRMCPDFIEQLKEDSGIQH